MWGHSRDFVGQDLAQEIGVEIADAAITDAPDTHVLLPSANLRRATPPSRPPARTP